jgi:hypothetical protein
MEWSKGRGEQRAMEEMPQKFRLVTCNWTKEI